MATIPWTDNEITLLREVCEQRRHIKDVSSLFPNRSKQAIISKSTAMKLPGLSIKRFTCDKHFWDVPNPINAYYAGFIAADGMVSTQGNCFSMKIDLSHVDICLLESFRTAVNSTSRILHPKRRSAVSGILYDYVSIKISEKSWEKPLREIWGLKERKTWDMSLPNIPEELMSHWFAGFVDGDGCYYCNPKNGAFKITIKGASDVALQGFLDFAAKFPRRFNKDRKLSKELYKGNPTYSACVGGDTAVYIAHHLMSLDCYHLPRKYAKVKSILESKPEFNLSLP